MRKTNLTIYLAKADKQPEDVVVGLKPLPPDRRPTHRPAPQRDEIPGVGTLFHRQVEPHVPDWAESFFGTTINSDLFNTSSSAAVLLVGVEKRLFAITFGQGRHLLEPDSLEDRFGLRVLLNTRESLDFRRVDSTSVAGNAGKNSEQLPRLSKLEDFTVDSITDTLDKVTATVHDDLIFTGAVTGSNSLSFSTEASVLDIKDLLKDILERFCSNDYKEWYPWVDNVTPVRDRTIIAQLEEKAVELINNHSKDLWSAPPDLINWDGISGFRIEGHGDELFYDIHLDDILTSFRKGLTNYSSLKGRKVYAVDAKDPTQHVFSWSAANCLYGEISIGDTSYCLNSGKWFCVSKDYCKRVNDEYWRSKPYDTSQFPEFKDGENEKLYNKKLADDTESYLLMDAKNIRHGAPNSQVELCDVLDGNDTFIHVKHYSGSATLSHLFSQGYNSAYLVKSDQDYVGKANDRIAAEPGGHGHTLQVGNVKLVIFAIICKNFDRLPNIPFFSRISYNEVVKKLKAMGVEARICAIPDLSKKHKTSRQH